MVSAGSYIATENCTTQSGSMLILEQCFNIRPKSVSLLFLLSMSRIISCASFLRLKEPRTVKKQKHLR